MLHVTFVLLSDDLVFNDCSEHCQLCGSLLGRRSDLPRARMGPERISAAVITPQGNSMRLMQSSIR